MAAALLAIAANAVGCVAALLTLPGTVELAVLTLAGVLPRRRPRPAGTAPRPLRLAAVVPAHDEEPVIDRTLASLERCRLQDEALAIVVVADNCTDATAERAAARGARVLVRDDPARRGKGHALAHAFGVLLEEGFDAFLVLDADTVIEPHATLLVREALAAGADALQLRDVVLNPGASPRTRLMNVAFLAFNVLRPRGRERLGLSTGVCGNGFGLTARTLRAVPWRADSVVEDLEYHLMLVRAGRRVRFVEGAAVGAEMPTGSGTARSQRARWEGGRLRILRREGPALLREATVGGRGRLWEPLLDLLTLPLGYHALLLAAAALAPFPPVRWLGLGGLAVLALHVLAGLAVGGGGVRDLLALLQAPGYVAWKLRGVADTLRTARGRARWVRTGRERPGAIVESSARTGP
jgi:cellulose synthase/poly-beta-1,6-N-acetylglucosamine synthase-like glycosyltransferase